MATQTGTILIALKQYSKEYANKEEKKQLQEIIDKLECKKPVIMKCEERQWFDIPFDVDMEKLKNYLFYWIVEPTAKEIQKYFVFLIILWAISTILILFYLFKL